MTQIPTPTRPFTNLYNLLSFTSKALSITMDDSLILLLLATSNIHFMKQAAEAIKHQLDLLMNSEIHNPKG